MNNFFDWLWGLFGRKRKPVDPPPPPPPNGGDMLALHNAERFRRGVLTLINEARLTRMAQAHAQSMADRGNGTVDHDRLGERLAQSGYPYADARENAVIGVDAHAAWQKWMKSIPHYANAMHPGMRDVGFGNAVGRDGNRYWCAVYGTTQ